MIVEFVGHWGVGKTTLAAALVSHLSPAVRVVAGREHVGKLGLPARARHPALVARLLVDVFPHLPELLGTHPGRNAALSRLRQEAAGSSINGLLVLDRGATSRLCSMFARGQPVSDRLLPKVLPRNTLTVLVEAPPALVRQRMARQRGRNADERRGRLVVEDLSSPAWKLAVEGYERTKSAVLSAGRPTIVVNNSGEVDIAQLADRILALASRHIPSTSVHIDVRSPRSRGAS